VRLPCGSNQAPGWAATTGASAGRAASCSVAGAGLPLLQATFEASAEAKTHLRKPLTGPLIAHLVQW
jgi:hypothetical protein